MKTIFTLLATLAITVTFAQQRLIAIKGSTTDAIATTLSDAIALAQPGDKIYLPGGFFLHTEPINKQVHIIGTGFQDGMNVMGRTTINSNLTLGDLADSSIFEGLYLTEYFTQTQNCVSDDITIKRCNIKGTGHIYTSNYINSQFINCVIRETLYLGYFDGSVNSVNGENNFIKNCFIAGTVYKTNSSSIENCILNSVGQCSNTFIKKNIFNAGSNNVSIYNSSDLVLENNLFKSGSVLLIPATSSIASEIGTVAYNELTDVFVNAPNINFNATYDFHLKPPFSTTPLNIGIYAGTYAWKDGSLPIIPNIEQNNSYLDVQAQQFKLNVKVVPQTH